MKKHLNFRSVHITENAIYTFINKFIFNFYFLMRIYFEVIKGEIRFELSEPLTLRGQYSNSYIFKFSLRQVKIKLTTDRR